MALKDRWRGGNRCKMKHPREPSRSILCVFPRRGVVSVARRFLVIVFYFFLFRLISWIIFGKGNHLHLGGGSFASSHG